MCAVLAWGCSDDPAPVLPAPPLDHGADAPIEGSKISPSVVDAVAHAGGARVVVAFKRPRLSGRSQRLREHAISEQRTRVLRELARDDFQLTHGWRTAAAMAGYLHSAGVDKLRAHPEVARVSLDAPMREGLAESRLQVGADQTLANGIDGSGVTVAVVDSGVDTGHPDFANINLVAEHCVCADEDGAGCCPNGATTQTGAGAAEDDRGHGTTVTSALASGGAAAATGVAPGIDLIAVKVLDSLGRTDASHVVTALDWIATNHPDVDVVNASLGSDAVFPGVCDSAEAWTMAYAEVIDALRANGTVFVTISQNFGDAAAISAPGCIDAAFTVGAVYDNAVGFEFFANCIAEWPPADAVACFSNASPLVDILAPGAMMTASAIGGFTTVDSGTSFAAPMVAGAAALLRQVDPNMTPDAVEETLTSTGVDVLDSRNGWTFPRLDALAAVGSVASLCGDGAVAATEGCDDGNSIDGDGCASNCAVETGYSCTGEPSVCTSTCGDGIVASDEGCDDGNLISGDGCSASCQAEGAGGAASGSAGVGAGSGSSDDDDDDGGSGGCQLARSAPGGGVGSWTWLLLLGAPWLRRRRR